MTININNIRAILLTSAVGNPARVNFTQGLLRTFLGHCDVTPEHDDADVLAAAQDMIEIGEFPVDRLSKRLLLALVKHPFNKDPQVINAIVASANCDATVEAALIDDSTTQLENLITIAGRTVDPINLDALANLGHINQAAIDTAIFSNRQVVNMTQARFIVGGHTVNAREHVLDDNQAIAILPVPHASEVLEVTVNPAEVRQEVLFSQEAVQLAAATAREQSTIDHVAEEVIPSVATLRARLNM